MGASSYSSSYSGELFVGVAGVDGIIVAFLVGFPDLAFWDFGIIKSIHFFILKSQGLSSHGLLFNNKKQEDGSLQPFVCLWSMM